MTSASSPRRPDNSPGSPSPGEPEFLAVGKLRRPHGVRGEILMDVLTDFPERLQPGVTIYVGPDRLPLLLASCRWHREAMLVSFTGHHNPEQAGELRNQLVFVRADDRPPLPEGEYYHHQLLGLKVIADTGAELGVLKEILETGANDVYVVARPAAEDFLLPAIADVILVIDLQRGEMRVRLLPGLLPDED